MKRVSIVSSSEIIIELIKSGFFNPAFTIFITLISFFAKYLIENRRRPFFSLPYPKQLEAIEWLKSPPVSSPDPLLLAEQQAKLKSYGLHQDWLFSRRLISFSSCNQIYMTSSINSVLRYSGTYSVENGNIFVPWKSFGLLALILCSLILFWIFSGCSIGNGDGKSIIFWVNLIVALASSIFWFWMLMTILSIKIFSSRFNKYECKIIINGVNYSDSFGSEENLLDDKEI